MPYQPAAALALGLEEVAIALGYGALGSHLGVAFRQVDGKPVVMELAFHRRLRVEDYPGPPGLWSASVVPMPVVLARQVVSLLRNFAREFQRTGEPQPEYGVNLKMTSGSIGADAEYVPREGSDGHTCSTFVAEAFRAARVPLVDLSTWPQGDPKHKAWAEAVVCMLLVYAKAHPETQAFGHANTVRKSANSGRLLPEEVAAAGQLEIAQLPASHAAVAERANAVLAEMRAACVDFGGGDFAKCVEAYRKKLAAIEAKAGGQAGAQPAPQGGAAA